MSYAHLRRWRIGSAAVVAIVCLGFVVDVTAGEVDVWTAVRLVAFTFVQWAAFWSPSSQLVRNARRRQAREHPSSWS